MLTFSKIVIQGILDYLEGLDDTQVRKVFKIFSDLASEKEVAFLPSFSTFSFLKGINNLFQQEGSSSDSASALIYNDLQIMIQKQLSNPADRYKKIGIIGSLTTIRSFGN